MTDEEVLVERLDGQERTADAQDAQQCHAVCPFVAQQQYDEVGYQCQSEHGGHAEKCRKAQHLAEDVDLTAFAIFVDRGHDGLSHLLDSSGNQRVSHGVPFGRLCVVAYILRLEQSSEDNRQHVVVHLIHDVGNQYLAAESEHFADGLQVYVQRGQPADIIQSPDVNHRDIDELLPGQTPIGIVVQGQYNADDAAE